jgi:hypothetical protein
MHIHIHIQEEDLAIAVDPETKQLLHYQTMMGGSFALDITRFEANPTVQV